MVWDADFNRAFNPKAIAVVGVSAIDPDSLPKGRFLGGLGFVQNLKERGFSGRIYPINPKAKEIAGLKVYPNVASVPEPVDLVVVAVPAKALASVFEDCIAANAKNIHVFTAGFEETGEEEGKRLGQEIKEIAQRGGLRIVGPNCMGLYVPSARLAMWHEGCTQGGAVAFLSQSGRIAQDYVEYAQGCGIKFSKVISYGNALTLDCTDFLEYLAHDPETRIIGMYLEGLKDGRRLTEQIKKINSDKPVIIWKGGLTEPGSRAVSSHTASMAGEMALWNSFFHQTGAVRAGSLHEIVDNTLAFTFLKPVKGRRVAIIGVGGGVSVYSADVCAIAGLEVPTLSAETLKELRSFIPSSGTMIKNPMDIGLALRDVDIFKRTLDLVAKDPLIDIIMLNYHWFMLRFADVELLNGIKAYLKDFVTEDRYGKPLLAVLESWTFNTEINTNLAIFGAELTDIGIPVYQSHFRASMAMTQFVRYYEKK